MANVYIQIKDKEIPIKIRNYSNSYNIRMFFKDNILNISKPAIISERKINRIIKANEEEIYKQYIEILSNTNNGIKQWRMGDKILYEGEEYTIIRNESLINTIVININREEKQFNISIPNTLSEIELKENIDKGIKNLFKNNTKVMLQTRLPYWSKVTKINYNSAKVRDATTRFGSCVPAKKALNFNSRLIMLSQDKIDAVIVHELCHIVHNNHSKDFYNLVKKYIPNYSEIDKWLKENSNLVNI